MEDFNEFAKKETVTPDKGLFNMVGDIAKKFDGKDGNELMKAVIDEARRGKQAGTLTNAEIDNFAAMLAPALDDRKRKVLDKVIADLKKL